MKRRDDYALRLRRLCEQEHITIIGSRLAPSNLRNTEERIDLIGLHPAFDHCLKVLRREQRRPGQVRRPQDNRRSCASDEAQKLPVNGRAAFFSLWLTWYLNRKSLICKGQ